LMTAMAASPLRQGVHALVVTPCAGRVRQRCSTAFPMSADSENLRLHTTSTDAKSVLSSPATERGPLPVDPLAREAAEAWERISNAVFRSIVAGTSGAATTAGASERRRRIDGKLKKPVDRPAGTTQVESSEDRLTTFLSSTVVFSARGTSTTSAPTLRKESFTISSSIAQHRRQQIERFRSKQASISSDNVTLPMVSPSWATVVLTQNFRESRTYRTSAKSYGEETAAFFSTGKISSSASATQLAQTVRLRTSSAVTDESSESPSGPKLAPATVELTSAEKDLFETLRRVTADIGLDTTLRVAGGWVRDKLICSQKKQLIARGCNPDGDPDPAAPMNTNVIASITSRYATKKECFPPRPATELLTDSKPVDIDIALDDMLGREFADHINAWLAQNGRKTSTVGMVLKNPEKSKHLETATMKIGKFWLDVVNLRAEEYAGDSRIPELMRIGTAEEDAYRRDLTINSLFYNINTGEVEDMTGRGFVDLERGIIDTPLAPLTTLLDDPLRVLRSIRFAARLRFTMSDELWGAASDPEVRKALEQKVSRERIGGEVDLMLKSPDPVGAMRLISNLNLASTVFPIGNIMQVDCDEAEKIYSRGLSLLSRTHDYLCMCKNHPPRWCQKERGNCEEKENDLAPLMLTEDPEARRLLWYASFLRHVIDLPIPEGVKLSKKNNRPNVMKLLMDDLKRPSRDAEGIHVIHRAADQFTNLIAGRGYPTAATVLLNDITVFSDAEGIVTCEMNKDIVDPDTEMNDTWVHVMKYRAEMAEIMRKTGPLWRAALVLSLCEWLERLNDENDWNSEDDIVQVADDGSVEFIISQYDTLATSILKLGLVGAWDEKALIDGNRIVTEGILTNLSKGPAFRDVMNSQRQWMDTHPGGSEGALVEFLRKEHPDFV